MPVPRRTLVNAGASEASLLAALLAVGVAAWRWAKSYRAPRVLHAQDAREVVVCLATSGAKPPHRTSELHPTPQSEVLDEEESLLSDEFPITEDQDGDSEEPAEDLASSSSQARGVSYIDGQEVRHYEGIFCVVREDDAGDLFASRWPSGGPDDLKEWLRASGPQYRVLASITVPRSGVGALFVARSVRRDAVRPFIEVEGGSETPELLGLVAVEGGRIVFQAQDKDFFKPLPIVTAGPKRFVGRYVRCSHLQTSYRLFPNGVADVLEDLGPVEGVSRFVIHAFRLPTEFPADVVAQTTEMEVPALADRVDLRDLPLVTIDGVDSRDFDDAVFAEPDTDPSNPGGWHIVVSIADVSHYVEPDSPLDREALARGNSVYLPDRCIPMLPEKLSNNLCSLRPGEDRACLGVHIWITATGERLRYDFFRGLMKSAARLTYNEVERFLREEPVEMSPCIRDRVSALHGAYKTLRIIRATRHPLEILAPEVKVVIGPTGQVLDVHNKERLESEEIIEEFMILANICAAEFLRVSGFPCPYRVHDEPTLLKVKELQKFAESQGVPHLGSLSRTTDFNRLLDSVKLAVGIDTVMQSMVLRSQAKACYAEENRGHFGLNLRDYCHFTSPIRRYADLLVHRLLRDAITGTTFEAAIRPTLGDVCQQISEREVDAMTAERDSIERFTALYLKSQVGEEFPGFISGISAAGLFVTLERINVSGLITMEDLPSDYYAKLDSPLRLEGSRSKFVFALGDRLVVTLYAADLAKGKLKLRLGRALALELQQRLRTNAPGNPMRGPRRLVTGARRSMTGSKRSLGASGLQKRRRRAAPSAR